MLNINLFTSISKLLKNREIYNEKEINNIIEQVNLKMKDKNYIKQLQITIDKKYQKAEYSKKEKLQINQCLMNNNKFVISIQD